MNKKATHQNDQRPTHGEVDFHGAALIDEKGREIPITDEMVRAVLDDAETSPPVPHDT